MRLTLAAAIVAVIGCGDNIHFGMGDLVVSPRVGLHTTEAGGNATFTVALGKPPRGMVTVDLISENLGEGTVSPASIVFHEGDYDEPRTVTITGVDDRRADGNRHYVVRARGEGFGIVDLDVTNDDDDAAGFAISPELGLMTSEAGMQASFSVALTSEPSADVTIPVASLDPSEGTTSVQTLRFTADDWDVPRSVVVTGMEDTVMDGPVDYTISLGTATSSDTGYAGVDPDDVHVVNLDDDLRGVVVSPLTVQTSENATQATFTVVLSAQPTTGVTIMVASSDPSEARVSSDQLAFTPVDWDMPQTVTVTGVDDAIADGDQPFTITLAPAISGDPAYSGIDPDDVAGINLDNDLARITVTPTSLVTTEGGGSAMFTVVLTSQPTDTVTIAVASSDVGEGTVSTSSLVFAPSNWNQPRTVTVTGVDDPFADGDQVYSVALAAAVSSDPSYTGRDPDDVTVTNLDDDLPGFTVEPTSGLIVTEFGDIDTFTIRLNTPPIANVTVSLTSNDVSEGTVTPTSVTFTPQNWNVPQTITVRGVNDNLADGNITFMVVTGPAASTDPAYAGLNPPDVQVTNIDNDTPQVYVRSRPRLTVSENGTTAIFRIGLTTQPLANVTCTLYSDDATEGAVSPTTITFTPTNWGARNVTVLGLDDTIVDGDVTFNIVTNACTSTDPAYNGQNPRDVGVVNRDND